MTAPRVTAREKSASTARGQNFVRRLPLLPALVFMILLTQVPFLLTIWYSFQSWNLLHPDRQPAVASRVRARPCRFVVEGHHLPRAERLAAAHAAERLGLVENDLLLRLRREQQARRERDRVFRAGVLAQPALHTVALNELQHRLVAPVMQRRFRTRADAGHAERAGLLVDEHLAVRRSGAERYALLRLGCEFREVFEREFERGSFLGGEIVGRGLRCRLCRLERPHLLLERRKAVDREQPEMGAAIAESVDDGLGESHLLPQRVAVLACFLRRCEHEHLACPVGEGRQQNVDADRSGMMDFERNRTRGQACLAPRELCNERAALARVVQQ